MAELFPVEVWPRDTDIARLDGSIDEATGLAYIAKGTSPASDPPLEIQYNRSRLRLAQILEPWNQGRVVHTGSATIGVFPIRYWMDGIIQTFEGTGATPLPGLGIWMVYLDGDGVLRIEPNWPAGTESFLPLAEVTRTAVDLSIIDMRTCAAFRTGKDPALWPLAVNLRVTMSLEVANAIDITLQTIDPAGAPLPGRYELHAWLSDTTAPTLAVAAPNGGATVTGGVLLATEVTHKRWRLVTAADGAAVLRIVHDGPRSWNLQAQLAGRITTSKDIIFV